MIINNAAKRNFTHQKVETALNVYLDCINNQSSLHKNWAEILEIIFSKTNNNDQTVMEALVFKSNKFTHDSKFMEGFFSHHFFDKLSNNKISANIFTDSILDQIYIAEKSAILDYIHNSAYFDDSLYNATLIYIKDLYKNLYKGALVRTKIKISSLAEKIQNSGWHNSQKNDFNSSTILYYLISYGLEYKESDKLLNGQKELILSENLSLNIENEYLNFKDSASEKNMLLITGAYTNNDIMVGFEHTFHNNGFNICAINANRYDHFENHKFEIFPKVVLSLTQNLKENIKNCAIGQFDIVIIHMHGVENKDKSDVALKMYHNPPKIESALLYDAIKDFTKYTTQIMLTSCNGQLTNNVIADKLKHGNCIITFGQNNDSNAFSTRAKDVSNIVEYINKYGIPQKSNFTNEMFKYYLMHLTQDSDNIVPIPTYSCIIEDKGYVYTSTKVKSYLFHNNVKKNEDFKEYVIKHKDCVQNILCDKRDETCKERLEECINEVESCLLKNLVDLQIKSNDGKFGVSAAIEFFYYHNDFQECLTSQNEETIEKTDL